MADSLSEIVNTTLSAADLEGGYDLITTDGNTRYAIKDVAVDAGPYTSVPATINNFQIGDFSSSASGSEIIDANSTLRLSPDSLSYYNLDYSNYSLSNQNFDQDATYFVNGNANGSDSNDFSANLNNAVNWTTDGNYYPYFKIDDSYYQIFQDNNSVGKVYYWSTAAATRQEVCGTSYSRGIYAPDRKKMYYFEGGYLKSHDPVNGEQVVSNIAFTFSTYPRMSYCNGYVFALPSNNYTQDFEIINVDTGARYNYGSLDNSDPGVNWQIWASYDAATDKFSVYRRPHTINSSSWPWRRTILNETKSQMDLKTANTSFFYTGANDTTQQSISGTAINFVSNGLYNNSYGGGVLYGSPFDGDKMYFCTRSGNATTYKICEFSWSANDVVSQFDTGRSYGLTVQLYTPINLYVPDAAEIAATNYVPALEYKIRMTGVKSVTS